MSRTDDDRRVARPESNRQTPIDRSARPDWIRVRVSATPEFQRVAGIVKEQGLHTVCSSASCPNQGECWAAGTATFMIGGNDCTRRCGFCDVNTSRPEALDPFEPGRVAHAVTQLGLRFAVVTCVARDDLEDGGAGQMAATIRAIRHRSPGTGIEVLISDYKGCDDALRKVLDAGPDVLNHNIETVERLQRRVRPAAGYARSLAVLRRAGELRPDIPRKSGLILGMGERDPEIDRTLRDLREAGVTLLTMGQYLRPSVDHLPVDRWLTPEAFDAWGERARELGFVDVASGPLVRSSYQAEKLARSDDPGSEDAPSALSPGESRALP
ncbi:MAG: lipoyl synthase [Myxococcota bacterium]|nr:lipoyl synthase [Myxococcota bacterium]